MSTEELLAYAARNKTTRTRRLGVFFGVGYRGRETSTVSPDFATIDEVWEWIRANRFRRYVVKQQTSLPGGGEDGCTYLDSSM